MDYTKPIELGIAEKLKKDEGYRKSFFRAFATDSIALQIRQLRKFRELKQAELAATADMKQSAVSRIEQAEYSSWTFNTLWRVAEALNARLIVRFQPIEDAIGEYEIKEGIETPSVGKATYIEISSSQGYVSSGVAVIAKMGSVTISSIQTTQVTEHRKEFVIPIEAVTTYQAEVYDYGRRSTN